MANEMSLLDRNALRIWDSSIRINLTIELNRPLAARSLLTILDAAAIAKRRFKRANRTKKKGRSCLLVLRHLCSDFCDALRNGCGRLRRCLGSRRAPIQTRQFRPGS